MKRPLTQTWMIAMTLFLACHSFRAVEKGEILYPLSSMNCKYERSFRHPEILRDDTLGVVTYRTDSTEMFLRRSNFLGFLVGGQDTEGADNIFTKSDSLLSALFQNGLFTSDLLIRAYTQERLYLNQQGDTLDHTQYTDSKKIKILNIRPHETPPHLHGKGRFLTYRI